MYDWLYFIRSNEGFHKLMDCLLHESGVSGITYLIFSEDVKCNNGRIFSGDLEFLIAVNFFTLDVKFKDDFVKSGLTLGSLVVLYEVSCEHKNTYRKALTITSRAKRIVFDRDLEDFLRKVDFKFEDGSTLTIPKISLVHRL